MMRREHSHDRYGLADEAGRWLLDNCADAYGAHGFVYATGRDGVTVAAGGDGAISVGVYSDDDALTAGDPLVFREWGTSTVGDIGEAVAFLRHWVGDMP